MRVFHYNSREGNVSHTLMFDKKLIFNLRYCYWLWMEKQQDVACIAKVVSDTNISFGAIFKKVLFFKYIKIATIGFKTN
jgi:hypothetical protein